VRYIRVFSVLAALSLLVGLLSARASASASVVTNLRHASAAAPASPHRRVTIHPTRLVPPLHPSLRVVHVRHFRVVQVHGTVRRVRVVPWHAVGAAPGRVRAQQPRIETTAALDLPSASGGISEYPVPTADSSPHGVAVTPNGDAWFAESDTGKIGEVTPGGSFTEYPIPAQPGMPAGDSLPEGVTVGLNGNLWFTTYSYIGEMTPSGSFTFFPITADNYAYDITPGPDGNVWFTEVGHQVGYVTPGGAVTQFDLPSGFTGITPQYITAGPDGLWFTALGYAGSGNYVYQMSTSGSMVQYPLPSTWTLSDITMGPDGRVWFGSTDDSLTAMASGGAYTTYTWPLEYPNGYSPEYIRSDYGSLVFANFYDASIGQMNPATGDVAFDPVPSGNGAMGVGVAPSGAIWFSENDGNAMGMVAAGTQFPPAVPTVETYGCGCEGATILAVRPESYRGDPVNTATGAYSDTVTDASLPGPGVAFTFTRAYTSLDTASGPLGPGWTDPFQASLSVSGSTVTFTSADGQQMTFTDSGGTYTPAAGVYAALSAVSGGYQLIAPDGTHYNFNTSGQLTSQTDRSSTGLTMTYSGSQLASVTTAGGRKVTFAYNSSGLLSSLTMPNSTTVSYGYTSGLLTSVTGLGGGVTKYAYNSADELTTITDPDGHVVLTNAYTSGRVTSQTNGDGKTTTFGWNAATQTATTTDPDGGIWTDVYNDNVLLQQTDPDGGTTYYTYDSNLDLIQVTDPLGNVTTMTYNAAGDMLTETAPAPLYYTQSWTYNSMNEVLTATDGRGNTTSYAYNSTGLLTSETDPLGKVTSYTYYPDGQLDTITDPDNHVTSYTYDSSDDLASVTDPAGRVTQYVWNSEGQLTSNTDPAGKATSYAYNNLGEQTSVTDPLGYVTKYGYDADGRKTSGTTAAGDVTSYAYDNDGNLTSVTDPLGYVTSYTYGNNGKVATETDPEGHVTSYVYNDDGDLTQTTLPGSLTESYTYNLDQQQTSYTDPGGDVTQYVNDPLGQVTSVTNPEGETTAYTYDSDGNLATTTSPDGLVTTSTYDLDNRLTGVAYSDGVTPDVSYVYDPAGELTSMSDGTGTTSYTDNADGQPTTVKNGAGQSVSYVYNADGNPTTITYPNGKAVTDGYNADQLLTSVTDWSSDKTSFGYNKDGVPTSETYPNGDTAAYTVSKDDQVTAITDTNSGGTTLAGFTYTRGKDGELTAATTTGSAISAPAQSYTYNPLGQLTGTGTASYGYDNVGDPTTLGNSTQTFNAGGQLATATTSGTTTTYTYNARGDRITATTSGTATSYGYNQADQLTSYTPATGAATTYAYNGDGLLMSETTSGTTTGYAWDTISTDPLMLTAGTTSYIYGPGGLAIESVNSSGTPTYYLQDQLGSTRLLTSSTGAVTGTYTYDAYGNVTSHTGTATSSLLYAGQYQDPSTGCYYLRNRYYDPTTAQFLTIDPAVSQTQAPYTYTSDSPLNATDPEGLVTEPPPSGGAASAPANPPGVYGPGCDQGLFKYGACPSESAAAGNTSEEVEQSAIGAGMVIGGALCPLLGSVISALFGGGTEAVIDTGEVTVYSSENAAGEVDYVGITNNVTRRAAEQFAAKGIDIEPIPGLQNLSRADARAVEQVLIEEYGGPGGGQLRNLINSIATSNGIYQQSIERGCYILSTIGYPAPNVCG